MVCHGPDPTENNSQELTPPPRHELMLANFAMEDSDDENDNIGYEPLPQGPESAVFSDPDSEDDEEAVAEATPPNDVPDIETIDVTLTRDVWNAPRRTDPIQLNSEQIQQVIQAMANFALTGTSVPDWAQSITEEQFRQIVDDEIDKYHNEVY